MATPKSTANVPITANFFARIQRSDACWLWTGGRGTRQYGKWSVRGKWYPAHRLAYTAFVGLIPDGMLVLHKCDNPPCVRPDHLFLGTHADNTADMIAKGRSQFSATACVHGHAFTPGNTRLSPRGHKECRECDRIKHRRQDAARQSPK